MSARKQYTLEATVAGLGVLGLVLGVTLSSLFVAGSSAVCLTIVANRWTQRHLSRNSTSVSPVRKHDSDGTDVASPTTGTPHGRAKPYNAEPEDMDAYVEQLLAQHRHMLLLRPQVAANLSGDQLDRAVELLHDEMSLVPDGAVFMAQPDYDAEDNVTSHAAHGHLVTVHAFYMDRVAVTNRQYQAFVDAGGYEEASLWDPSVLTGVLDFVDQTGELGPRFWSHGTCDPKLADHPVVGVNWYEASAYARWTGKRLPTDPEWVKAGAWPVSTVGSTPQQRKYPWGNSMDDQRANLWASGPGTTVPVNEYNDGVNVGGIYQLVGNVWEWTSGVFGTWHANDRQVASHVALKSLRGGAFDTYFDSHAACQFQSGDNPLARKHNVGFRSALGICDLAPIALQLQAADAPNS